MTWKIDDERCGMYEAERTRYCRNKKHADSGFCRRHLREYLEAWEERNPGVTFYLKHRDVLDARDTDRPKALSR